MGRKGTVELFLVERNPKQQEKQLLRVKARDVYLTVAKQG
jgi:hypothetical protein